NNNQNAIYENDVNADPTVQNNLFFSNPNGVYFDEATTSIASGSSLNALAEADNNIDGDPLFENAGAGDYSITETSPARDAGILAGSPAFDKDSQIRDTLPDIGFDERAP